MSNTTIVVGALIAGVLGESLFAAGLVAQPQMAPQAGLGAGVGGPAVVAPPALGRTGVELPKPDAQIQPNASTQPGDASPKVREPATGLAPLAQPEVAAPITRREPALVKYEVETHEVTALMDDGVAYTYWTFGNTVPGPMLRIRQGDTVELTLRNSPESEVSHSIDLHAVTGPGGGAKATQLAPGESATIRFKALNPGV